VQLSVRSHFWSFTGVLQEIRCEVTRKVGFAVLDRDSLNRQSVEAGRITDPPVPRAMAWWVTRIRLLQATLVWELPSRLTPTWRDGESMRLQRDSLRRFESLAVAMASVAARVT